MPKLQSVAAAFAAIVLFSAWCAATGARAQVCEEMAKDPAYAPLLAPSPPSIPGARVYAYKSAGGRSLQVYVFGVATPTPRAAMVFLFGGGWVAGNVEQYAPQARYFAERGMVTVLVDYRVFCRDKATIVDEIADAKDSVRWVRAHAAELGIDPARIAVTGQSSGGHLALSTAMFEDLDPDASHGGVSSKPNLLLLLYPCVDITSEQDRVYSIYVAGPHGRDVSPLYHVVGGLPPTLIIHGDADPLFAGARRYCDAARVAGDVCEFTPVKGAPHGFFFAPSKAHDWYEQGLNGMERFLVDAGYAATPGGSR